MKPEPVPTAMVCSLCGLAWDRHAEKSPTILGCVELLKQDLAKKPVTYWNTGTVTSTNPVRWLPPDTQV